jgi:hypothetical protein
MTITCVAKPIPVYKGIRGVCCREVYLTLVRISVTNGSSTLGMTQEGGPGYSGQVTLDKRRNYWTSGTGAPWGWFTLR